MFDSHLHTTFSTDSTMKIKSAMDKSDSLNIGLVITEHMDLKFPVPGEFVFDVEDYFKQYNPLRSDKLLIGIELGMRTDCVDENEELIEKNEFDYVIGSIHTMNNMDIYDEVIYNQNKNKVYTDYFKVMAECLRTHDCIDSLGHLDYIARYARYEDTEIYYETYSDYIDEILKIIIQKGKAIEINTRRLLDKKAIKNMIKIYKRYKEFGGNIVTLGSDSHHENNIASSFNVAKEIIETCALKPVYFKNRKIEYDSIY